MKAKNIEKIISRITELTPGAVEKVTETARKYEGRALKLFLNAAENTAYWRDPEAVKKVAEVADMYTEDIKKMKSAMKDIGKNAWIAYITIPYNHADVGVVYSVIKKYLNKKYLRNWLSEETHSRFLE